MTTTEPTGVKVPFARVEISPDAQEAALEVLRSGWVTSGPQVPMFEQDLQEVTRARHAVAVSSCTAAIELSLRALRLPAGAPVLTPSLTFCGAVQAIIQARLRPVLVDVDPTSLVPTPENVARAAARAGRPAALVVQHQAGYPVDAATLAAAAGLPLTRVVEDAAHGLGGVHADGTPVGARGHAVCLSFYATKNLPIGEGGAVVTDDPEFADVIARTRLHGMSRDSWARYLPGGGWRYRVDVEGMKANLTDVQAAVGRAQLRHFPQWQQRRADIASRYDGLLAGVAGLELPARPAAGGHAWHLYQVRVTAEAARTRDEVIDRLARAGIGTSVHFIPVHQLGWFAALLGAEECASVPVTDAVAAQVLSLPMHPGLSDLQVDVVGHTVAQLCHPDHLGAELFLDRAAGA